MVKSFKFFALQFCWNLIRKTSSLLKFVEQMFCMNKCFVLPLAEQMCCQWITETAKRVPRLLVFPFKLSKRPWMVYMMKGSPKQLSYKNSKLLKRCKRKLGQKKWYFHQHTCPWICDLRIGFIELFFSLTSLWFNNRCSTTHIGGKLNQLCPESIACKALYRQKLFMF